MISLLSQNSKLSDMMLFHIVQYLLKLIQFKLLFLLAIENILISDICREERNNSLSIWLVMILAL